MKTGGFERRAPGISDVPVLQSRFLFCVTNFSKKIILKFSRFRPRRIYPCPHSSYMCLRAPLEGNTEEKLSTHPRAPTQHIFGIIGNFLISTPKSDTRYYFSCLSSLSLLFFFILSLRYRMLRLFSHNIRCATKKISDHLSQ